MAAFAARALLCTLCALALGACRASSPPFWPEENCLNQVSTADYAHGVAYDPQGDFFQYMTTPPFGAASPAVNPYNGRFETFAYAGGSRHAGPMLNDSSTPCRLVARVGEPMAFTVYAEDMDAPRARAPRLRKRNTMASGTAPTRKCAMKSSRA